MTATSSRGALYLDFDHVFGGLHQIDPALALGFARNPGVWLQRLTDRRTTLLSSLSLEPDAAHEVELEAARDAGPETPAYVGRHARAEASCDLPRARRHPRAEFI
ncbi:MAG: hypothetical protein ACSLEW_05140 [Nocardioides sp.]